MSELVYYSSRSENSHRFIKKLGSSAVRLPFDAQQAPPSVDRPFVLLTPTYGGGAGTNAVPKPVIRFLNCPRNRSLIRGVIASGNTNFGEAYGLAGRIVAAKCGVPLLYRFELLGTEEDVTNVKQGLKRLWTR